MKQTPAGRREAQAQALRGGTWPERKVVSTGSSPMSSKLWAALSCGHHISRRRRPRVGSIIVCEQCARVEDQR